MTFTLKPTRMTKSDLRPSLSYRIGVEVRSRTACHWADLVLTNHPALFEPDQADRRTAKNFLRFASRFAVPDGDAVIHVPPSALLAIAGARRIFAGAALFDQPEGGQPLAVLRPESRSVYVDATGFTDAGLQNRFGFSARPGVTGKVVLSRQPMPVAWPGDLPVPGVAAALSPHQTGQFPVAAGASAEELIQMQQPQGFMHKGGAAPMAPAQPPHPAEQPATGAPGNVSGQAAPVDCDDGYRAPPATISPPNGQSNAMPGVDNVGYLSRKRQKVIASLLTLGINRLLIDHGKIKAEMNFSIDAHSAAEENRARRFEFRHTSSVGGSAGIGPWSVNASMSNSIGIVNTTQSHRREEMNQQVSMNADIELHFHSGYLPLNQYAATGSVQRIRAVSVNPSAPVAQAPARTSDRSAQNAARSVASTPINFGTPPTPHPIRRTNAGDDSQQSRHRRAQDRRQDRAAGAAPPPGRNKGRPASPPAAPADARPTGQWPFVN